MKSLRVPNRSTGRNNISKRNYLSAHSIIDMGVSSNLDDFFAGVFGSIGIEINRTYKISELLKTFNDKNIKVLSVCGIECPSEINPDIRDIITSNNYRKKIFGNMLFEENDERENFYEILEHLDDSYKITAAKVLPSFTEMNHNISIKDRYTILLFGCNSDDKLVKESIIAVEIS